MDQRTNGDGGIADVLWQVEEAKLRDLPTGKAMNYVNLSREAQGFGNQKLASSLLIRARDMLFNEYLSSIMDEASRAGKADILARAESAMRKARDLQGQGMIKQAYAVLAEIIKKDEAKTKPVEAENEEKANLYTDALGSLQKVWIKMRHEEGRGKEIASAKDLMKEAKKALASQDFPRVSELSERILREIQTPQERLTEETGTTIEEIAKTLKALFPTEPRSPKERFFKRQIEDLIIRSREALQTGAVIDSINASRKAREILTRLEQETIKGEIPKQIIELRASLDELREYSIDISYEDYLLKQVEETFWSGNYIESRKTANKLWTILTNAKTQFKLHQLNDRFGSLSSLLKDRVGKEGYLEAREFLDKAKLLMEQRAFDMANSFLDKATEVLAR
jgi:flagellin-specific chaperone FliS